MSQINIKYIIRLFMYIFVASSIIYYIYYSYFVIEHMINLHAWWGKDDIGKTIFEDIFRDIENKYDEIQVYSVFGSVPTDKKSNVLYVQYTGESYYNDPSLFDINFIPTDDLTIPNNIIFPYGAFSMWYNHYANHYNIQTLLTKRIYTYNKHNKFCLFSVGNPMCKARNIFFEKLSKYKRVDSCGTHLNNMDGINCPGGHSSPEYFDFISNYKFMICFENESHSYYLTEKLLNAYYSGTIPIYWGDPHLSKYVNMDSILYLKPNYTEKDMKELIQQIIQLDNDDQLYKKKFQQTFFKNGVLPHEFDLKKIREKVNKMIHNK